MRHSLVPSPSSCGAEYLKQQTACRRTLHELRRERRDQRPGWAGNHIGFYPYPTGNTDVFTRE
jgi:hypothetical protein